MSTVISRSVNLLVVDDSSFMRHMISDILSSEKNIKIETVSNGKQALNKIRERIPDIITLDLEMGVMNGIEFLEVLKKENISIPVIILSKFVNNDASMVMKAFELGAIDAVHKPEAGIAYEIDKLKTELLEKIHLVINKKIKILRPDFKRTTLSVKSAFVIPKVMVIGASTGGPPALYEIFSRLPKLKLPVLVVQHMPAGFTESFAKRLNDIGQMEVKIAEEGEVLRLGTAYVAPGNYHLTVNKDYNIELIQTPQVNGVRPSIDVTLDSIADVFGGRVLSVILTGMGSDGAKGVEKIKALGGKCLAQDESSSAVFGMPEAVINAGLADSVMALDKIPEEIVKYLLNWN